MKKIVFVLIILLLGLFIPASFASGRSMQTLTETVSFPCSGSNRPGGPCEGVYIKKDHKWFKFEIPALSDYELSMGCTVPDLEEDERCNEYSGLCEVLIEGVGMVGGLNPGFTKEQKKIKVKCTQCRTGGFYLTFRPTNCKVEVKYKSYGSCDNYCKSTLGDDFYGQMVGANCECIRGEKKEKPEELEEQQGVGNRSMVQEYEYCTSLKEYEECWDCCRSFIQKYGESDPHETASYQYLCFAYCNKLKKSAEETKIEEPENETEIKDQTKEIDIR